MIKRELLKYVGDISQLFSVKEYRLTSGLADGVRGVDIKNGSGLEMTILPDRALDISSLSFKGINFSYMSKTGIVAPQYFSHGKTGFLRSFYGGFLTTCGLRQVGSPCIDGEEELGLHGRIANIPAEQVYAGIDFVDDLPVATVRGKVREASFFGENILLTREIKTTLLENGFTIRDRVENLGFRKEPLMILYHMNLGYPLLSSKSYFLSDSQGIYPRDEEAARGLDRSHLFSLPEKDYKEQVFYHKMKGDLKGNTYAGLVNPIQEMGIIISFNKNSLWNLTQWKQLGEGEYVLGIEPGNCHVGGRKRAREDSVLEYIQPGEVRDFEIKVLLFDSMEEINKFTGENDDEDL